MKKLVLNCLVIAALAVSAAFAAGNDLIKLPEIITYDYGNYVKFEYDSQNRISKMSWYDMYEELTSTVTFTYIGNDLVKVGSSGFSKSGNKITSEYFVADLNNDGSLSKLTGPGIWDNLTVEYNYQYQGGNISKLLEKNVETWENGTTTVGSIVEYEYKYDKNKSPFVHCKTPKWYMIRSFSNFCGQNNEVEKDYWWMNNANGIRNYSGKIKYAYVYDNDGYPIKRTKKFFDQNGNEYEPEVETDEPLVIEFKYIERNSGGGNTATTSIRTVENEPSIASSSAVSNEPAVLHIYRKRKPLDVFPKRFDVLLDHVVAGNSTNNWKTTVTVNTFGTKTISGTLDGRKAEVRINFQPGGVYYVRSDVDTKTIDTGQTRTTTDRSGKTTTSKVTEIHHTPILQLVDQRVGEKEFNAISVR